MQRKLYADEFCRSFNRRKRYYKACGRNLFCAADADCFAGGAQRVAGFTCKTIPFMAVLYLLMTFGIIFVNFERLPNALSMIFKGAFDPSAVTGGAVGSAAAAVFTGASRGVFSNEAGLGTSAMAHSASSHTDGVQQGLFGIFEVFADTVVIWHPYGAFIALLGCGHKIRKGCVGRACKLRFRNPLR